MPFHVKRLDHVGVAARSEAEASALFGAMLGLPLVHSETIEGQGVDTRFYPAGEATLEVLLDTGAGGPVGRFLAKHGPGLHHVAFEVDDLDAALSDLAARGFRLIDERPRAGAMGKRIAFVHPASTMGLLVELVEHPKA